MMIDEIEEKLNLDLTTLAVVDEGDAAELTNGIHYEANDDGTLYKA